MSRNIKILIFGALIFSLLIIFFIWIELPEKQSEKQPEKQPLVSEWSYKKSVTISNSGSALTDYQVLITLDTASLISAGKMRADCRDIKFTDSDGSTQLSHWLESGCNNINDSILYATYYGNSGHPSNHDDLTKDYRYNNLEVKALRAEIDIPSKLLTDYRNHFFTTWLNVEKEGNWQFAIDGNDAVEVEIDGQIIASWYGSHAPCNCQDYKGSINLNKGWHKLIVRHERDVGGEGVTLYFKNPGGAEWQVFSTTNLKGKAKLSAYLPSDSIMKSPRFIKNSFSLDDLFSNIKTKIWVKVPSVPPRTKTIYLYYGNPSATSQSKMWNNIEHLGIYNGVFDYNIIEMQRRTGGIISIDGRVIRTCILKSNGNVDCFDREDNYTERDAIGITVGDNHICILKSNGNVDCYGNNDYNQADDYTEGDAIGVTAGGVHTCILKSNGNVGCYGHNKHDYSKGDAIGIAAGGHTCILKSNGNVDCYGDNYYGQASDYTGGDAIGVAVGGTHTCVLKSNGNVDCNGNNKYGQADDYTGRDAIGVMAAIAHTCILKSDGNVDCYGYNSHGQASDYLGGDAIGVMGGVGHTCILKSNGNVDCYGQVNYKGEDVKNPFRRHASLEPTIELGREEILKKK